MPFVSYPYRKGYGCCGHRMGQRLGVEATPSDTSLYATVALPFVDKRAQPALFKQRWVAVAVYAGVFIAHRRCSCQ